MSENNKKDKKGQGKMQKGTGQIQSGTEEIQKTPVPNVRRVKLTVAYDGTDYCGWQIQPNGITVEEVLNRTISRVTREDIQVIGASRTDSGVHALGNVAVFDTASTIPPNRMAHAINQKLPKDIVITESNEVPKNWHPRYQHTITKTYKYHIYNGAMPNPLKRRTSTFISFPLDVEKMRKGAVCLVGEHDFASFCNIRTNVEDTVRTVYKIDIQKEEEDITITIAGNGFLYNMVRIIAGTLIRVGRGFYKPEKVKEILEAKVRTEAGVTAPACGLVLERIEYGE